MTPAEFYDFSLKQVEWYNKQNDFCDGQIAWCNNQLKRERARDKELATYALQKQPDDPLTLRIFGGNYVGDETRKLTNERAKYYREKKHNNKRIEYYKRQCEYWGSRIESKL